MGLTCGADLPQTQMLQPPKDLFIKNDGISSIIPFTLQGGPFTTTRVVDNTSEDRLNKPISELNGRELRDTDYTSVDIPTDNIRTGSSDTTLRYDGDSYTLDFMAIHRGIWFTNGDSRPSFALPHQVSLVFTTSSGSFFQLVIPIEVGGTAEEENKFLRAWLNPTQFNASGDLTVNDLLRVSEDPAPFAVIPYCLQFNGGERKREVIPYTICIFNTSIKIQSSTAPAWFSKPESDRKIRFGPILHLMKPTTFRSTITHINTQGISVTEISKEISGEQRFSTDPQTSFVPRLYSGKVSDLAGRKKQTEGFANPTRGLQNVKCYPIDLATQVDDQGNIFVDQVTNKPLSVDDVKGAGGKVDDSENNGNEEAAARLSQFRFWFFIAIIGLVALVFLIVVILYGLRATSASNASPSGSVVVAPSP